MTFSKSLVSFNRPVLFDTMLTNVLNTLCLRLHLLEPSPQIRYPAVPHATSGWTLSDGHQPHGWPDLQGRPDPKRGRQHQALHKPAMPKQSFRRVHSQHHGLHNLPGSVVAGNAKGPWELPHCGKLVWGTKTFEYRASRNLLPLLLSSAWCWPKECCKFLASEVGHFAQPLQGLVVPWNHASIKKVRNDCVPCFYRLPSTSMCLQFFKLQNPFPIKYSLNCKNLSP